MLNKMVVLPSKEEMLKRLLEVDSSVHFQKGLYPSLLDEAGEQVKASGVVMLIQMAIIDYTEVKGGHPLMLTLLGKRTSEFIDALVLDEEVAEETKVAYEAMASR